MVHPVKGSTPPPRPPRADPPPQADPLAGLPPDSPLHGLRQLPAPPLRLCGPSGDLRMHATASTGEPLRGLRQVPADEVAPAIRRTVIGMGDI